jgi:hypothetical protein
MLYVWCLMNFLLILTLDIVCTPVSQLECLKCGNSWYASRDSISSLTIESVNPANPVGSAPGATTKFEEVEKAMVSPRESDKTTNGDIGQKEIPATTPTQDPQSASGDVAPVARDSNPIES